MSRFLSLLFGVVYFTSLPVLTCGICAKPALGQMNSHSVSVALTAILPEKVSVVASLAPAKDDDDSAKRGMISISVTTNWVTKTQRDSISVYLDYPSPTRRDAESSDRTPPDQRLFRQRLSIENRSASRSDNVDVPLSAISGLRSAQGQGFLKLSVQML